MHKNAILMHKITFIFLIMQLFSSIITDLDRTENRLHCKNFSAGWVAVFS